MKRVIVSYKENPLTAISDLVWAFSGYFNTSAQVAVLPYSEDLVDELERRGIKFRVEVIP